MNRFEPLTDELIQAAFEERARRADPAGLGAEILALTATTRQRPAWRLHLAKAFVAPAPRGAWIVLVMLAALLGVAIAIALIGQRPQPPFSSGLLAYSRDGDVYLANADGSGVIKVLHDPGVVFSAPVWSPDDRWLALEGSGAVFILDPRTLALRRIADGDGATWSSDGTWLAFVKASLGAPATIEIIDVKTGTLRNLEPKLTAGTSLGTPLAWSPDARWFLARVNASTGARLVRVDALTGDMVEVAPMYHLAEAGAHWSSDSRRFAFARPDACNMPPCASSIVVEDADLSIALAISDSRSVTSNPVWSPDDAWIAFTSGEVPATATLSIVRPDGRDLRVLTRTAAYPQSLAWSADGTELDFSTADPGLRVTGELTALRLSDGLQRTVGTARGADGYGWQVIAAGRPLPVLPSAVPSPSLVAQTTAPFVTPLVARAADATTAWSGLALDAYCEAGVLDLRSITFRTVGSTCPNSDGNVAFAPRATAYAMSELDGSVTIVRGAGAPIKALDPITLNDGSLTQVDLAWSPDGRWLSLRRCHQGPAGDCTDVENIVVSADGLRRQRLSATPSWSPDSQRLVVEAPDGTLLVGSPDGASLHPIGLFPMPSSWSPDAARFAFIRDGDAWIANADGTGVRNITNFASGGAFDAIWSPDGRFIAVIQESQLWILNLGTGDLMPIELGPGRDSFYGIHWAPDSARLAVVVGPGDTPATLIVRTDDWTATASSGTGIDDVAWSPDGRFIAFMDRSSKPGQIDIANRDGSGRHMIWAASDAASHMTWIP
jgi:Tol biopolymer transport system component